MTIDLNHAAFRKGIDDVHAGVERLSGDRDRIDARVSGFLGAGWTGPAADSFVDAWADWKAGATDVVEGLTAMGQLLDAAHRDLVASDESSQQALDSVSRKIVERLG